MIQSVAKAMRILAVIADGKAEPVPLGVIAAQSGYPKPTCAHIVDTLCEQGYVQRVSHAGGYRLGPALYHLTRYGRYEEELISVCHPVLRWMEHNTQATALLAVMENRQKFIIDYVDSSPRMFSEYQLIRRDALYRTATGRAILSRMDRVQLEEIYRQYGAPLEGEWAEVTDFDSLCREVEYLRMQKVVPVHQSLTSGCACALMQGEICIGAVGLGWWNGDLPQNELAALQQRMERVLRRGVKEIERRLSYQAQE